MKKWIFILVGAFSFLSAETAALNSIVCLQDRTAYFVLSDRTFWKVMSFEKRWRSMSEWWNNVSLAPEEYDTTPSDWKRGTDIEIYSKAGNLAVAEADASNQELIKQATHLLVNRRTAKILFAIAMEPGDCLTQLAEESRQDGFKEGVIEGRRTHHRSTTEAYENGHSEGYKSGCADGFRSGYAEGFRHREEGQRY